MYLWTEINPLLFALLCFVWMSGGYLILTRAFDIPAEERPLLGLALGMVLSTFFANFLGRVLPTPLAFWAAAALTLTLGLALAWPLHREMFPRAAFQPGHWLAFALIFWVFTLAGRGLGIFDDYQNIPHVSTLAAGDLPPHFAFNPDLRWGYHYFLLLVAAQFMRLADSTPWAALDVARGLTLALSLMLAGFWAYRLTKSRLAQAFSLLFVAFAGGARWIFYLLPATLMNNISSNVSLIGSGADSGANLGLALYKNWNIEGLGPLPFPFVYGSGLDASLSTLHNGFGSSAVLIILILMLTSQRIQHTLGYIPLIITLASLALANEVTFVFLYFGFGIAALAWMAQNRAWRLPASFWRWVGVLAMAGSLSLFQGGVIGEAAFGRVEQLIHGQNSSYYQVTFALSAPQFLSAHLGYLPLANPLFWLAILAETGLAALALPWVLRNGWHKARKEYWLQAAWFATILVSLATVFIQYTGNAGPTAMSRLHAHFLLVIKLSAVPLIWKFVQKRGESFQVGALAWGAATIFSGLALFGAQLAAMPNPTYGTFLTPLDEQIFHRQWNQLETGALVFDPIHYRAPSVLGRLTRAASNYGPPDEAWHALEANPLAVSLSAAGFDYVYYDYRYGRKFDSLINQPCAEQVDYAETRANDGTLLDYRKLVRVSACQ